MSRFVMQVTVGLALVALCVSPTYAQGGGRNRGGFGGRGGNPAMLLGAEQLQKELKITEEQKGKIKEILEESMKRGREGFANFRDMTDEERTKAFAEMQKRGEEVRKKLVEVLTTEQAQRFRGITLQLAGTSALTQPEIAQELKLSDEQVKQLKTISEETNKKRRELFSGGRGASEEERAKSREKMTQLQKDADEEALAVLTADQRAAMEKLKGAEFKLDRSAFGGRGSRRGGEAAPKKADAPQSDGPKT